MLEGLKVVEFATYVAGPSAAVVLADWGADVMKIESPAGDPTRHVGANPETGAASPVFEFENRGKRGIVLDISYPEGRAALLRILKDTDIFITNLRPGSMAKHRLDYESIRDELPKLIYASISGYGLQGDHVDQPAFDIAAFWTRGGYARATIPEGVEPFQPRNGAGDAVCALATVSAVLSAVIERGRTGKGKFIEASLTRAAVFALGWDFSLQLKNGSYPHTQGRRTKINPASNYFKTKDDRWIVVLPRGNSDWTMAAICANRPHIVADERFQTIALRTQNKEALLDELEAGFAEQTLEELAPKLKEVDMMWAPLQSLAEVTEDPYAHAAGCFIEVTDQLGATFKSPASPARFPGIVDRTFKNAPALGGDTRAILTEVGYSDDEIDKLIASGAAGAP